MVFKDTKTGRLIFIPANINSENIISKKFTCPQRLKTIPNTGELIAWYEDKLGIMEHRQDNLSVLLSDISRKLKEANQTIEALNNELKVRG